MEMTEKQHKLFKFALKTFNKTYADMHLIICPANGPISAKF